MGYDRKIRKEPHESAVFIKSEKATMTLFLLAHTGEQI
jgi:hypothetical protein